MASLDVPLSLSRLTVDAGSTEVAGRYQCRRCSVAVSLCSLPGLCSLHGTIVIVTKVVNSCTPCVCRGVSEKRKNIVNYFNVQDLFIKSAF